MCQAVAVGGNDQQSPETDRPGANVGTVRRSPDVVFNRVGPNEEVAMAIGGHTVVELRGSALEIWRLILPEVRIDVLVEQLAEIHDVEPAAIESDVVAAVDRLVAERLLERVQS